ncbi:30S ribosomal protein S4 [Patescibacteria group bacterium]|nr:30S ribosomal protein S4 [Patescibacteria group bacterium]MBU1123402.1 30S ribosomal protein S4 [Patescibacteria group bacterium]MBU1911438.1 30S ribosomal protein S4 [Patescibacteria group bacterium]
MKFTGPKAKRCRRQGTNIYGSDKYDKILQRKPQPPGKGPRTRLGRKSAYSQQLAEKQKVRDIYGLSEKQFHNLYKEAAASMDQTGEVFKQMLERRLDNTVYRAGFALTRLQARQFVGHGHFAINGRRVTIPSYRLRAGDVIELRESSKSSPVFGPVIEAHEKYMPPAWMKVDSHAIKIEIISIPDADSAEQAIDIRQVIEFYSRK